MCTSGDEAYCPKQIPTGFKCDGTFQRMCSKKTHSCLLAEYAVYEADYLIPIPEPLDSAATAPLLCAGATVYSGLKAAKIQFGQVSLRDGLY
jgi:propanol-preferring alcohol dehydrogenase